MVNDILRPILKELDLASYEGHGLDDAESGSSGIEASNLI